MDYTINTILYATDLGPYGPDIFNHAYSLAKQFNAKIHVVHVVEPISEYAHSLIDVYMPVPAQDAMREAGKVSALEEMRRRLNQFCADKLHADAQSVVADMRVVEGLPAQTILDEAARVDADLIVLGSHGLTALGEIFLGSVAHKVTIKAKVPVLLVPIQKRD